MKEYKIQGHEVREIRSTDSTFIYYIESVGQPKRKKWICKVFCKDSNREDELLFSSLKEAETHLKMFGYSYSKI